MFSVTIEALPILNKILLLVIIRLSLLLGILTLLLLLLGILTLPFWVCQIVSSTTHSTSSYFLHSHLLSFLSAHPYHNIDIPLDLYLGLCWWSGVNPFLHQAICITAWLISVSVVHMQRRRSLALGVQCTMFRTGVMHAVFWSWIWCLWLSSALGPLHRSGRAKFPPVYEAVTSQFI